MRARAPGARPCRSRPRRTPRPRSTSFGAIRVACDARAREQLDALPAAHAARSRVPRIETTPQSISASTCPVSPTIRVLSETIAPLGAAVDAAACRGSAARPRTPMPSSRKPFRSSAERPLIFSMRVEPSTGRYRPRPPRSSSSKRRLSSASFVKGIADLALAAAAPRDLDARPERGAQPLLGGARVGVLAAPARRPRGARSSATRRSTSRTESPLRAASRAELELRPRRARGPAARGRGRRRGAPSATSSRSSRGRRSRRSVLAIVERSRPTRRAISSCVRRNSSCKPLEGLRLLDRASAPRAGCSRRGPAPGAARRARRAA